MNATGTLSRWAVLLLFACCLGLSSCAYSFTLPAVETGNEDDADPAAVLALLFLLNQSNKSGSSSASECSNASGMVICIPSGLAE